MVYVSIHKCKCIYTALNTDNSKTYLFSGITPLGLERLFHFKIVIPYIYEIYSNSFKTLNFSSGFNKETDIDYHRILNETITFKLSLADR